MSGWSNVGFSVLPRETLARDRAGDQTGWKEPDSAPNICLWDPAELEMCWVAHVGMSRGSTAYRPRVNNPLWFALVAGPSRN